jgi:putative endonuclease
MFYVYVIESESSGSWYIGFTTDIEMRVEKHNQNGNTSTSNRGSWKLIYYEAYLEKDDATGREKFLKSGSGWRFLKKQMQHFLASKQEQCKSI